jgi:hypothetical protein
MQTKQKFSAEFIELTLSISIKNLNSFQCSEWQIILHTQKMKHLWSYIMNVTSVQLASASPVLIPHTS